MTPTGYELNHSKRGDVDLRHKRRFLSWYFGLFLPVAFHQRSIFKFHSATNRVLVGKPEVKRPMGKPRRRWVDNIRTDLQEVGYGYVDWIGLARDRDRWRTLVSAVMNLRVP